MIAESRPALNDDAAGRVRRGAVRHFQNVLWAGDVVIIGAAVLISHVARFGFTDAVLGVSSDRINAGYLGVSVIMGCLWLLLLRGLHTYRESLLGTGTEEYTRILEASLVLFGGVAIASYVFQIQLSRRYFLVMLPIGLIGLFIWRWIARKILVVRRGRGDYCRNALIVGSSHSASAMLAELRRRPEMGVHFVGACLSDAPSPKTLARMRVPIVGGVGDVIEVMGDLQCDALIITASPELTPQAIRRISWAVDPSTQVILAPSIVDVAGPRMHLRPVNGLSLVEVEMPRFDGGALLMKRAIDIAIASVLCVILIPLWIIVSILIKIDDGGPVFFMQPRVGLGGTHFNMIKFRSMRTDAEKVLAELKKASGQDAGNGVMFKMKDDPRVTKIGRILRATSIDELPQLFNVIKGDMSLVGPRPPLPREVEAYEKDVHRKFLVKPGITGLWQVSGRSSLSWEESVRLDLYYVENWSLTGDLQILFRTFKAVLKRDGAY